MRPSRLLRLWAPLLPYATLVAATVIAVNSIMSAAEAGAAEASAAAPQAAAAPPAAVSLETAHEAFRNRHHAEAYGRFAALADAGDAIAASVALAMVTHGPALFGAEWSATPGQLRRWSALAAEHRAQRLAAVPDHDRGE